MTATREPRRGRLGSGGYAGCIPLGTRSTRFGLALALLALATGSLLVLGTELRRKTTSSPTTQRADGSLTLPAKPLTVEALSRARPGSASEAVLRLWFWAQWVGGRSVLPSYDPRLVSGLGADKILAAYRYDRLTLAQIEPQVAGESAGSGGTVVRLRVLRADLPPFYVSYTLRKVHGTWYITYDTLLADDLAAAIQALNTPAKRVGNAPPSAVQAGLAAARRYRDVSSSLRGPPSSSSLARAPV